MGWTNGTAFGVEGDGGPHVPDWHEFLCPDCGAEVKIDIAGGERHACDAMRARHAAHAAAVQDFAAAHRAEGHGVAVAGETRGSDIADLAGASGEKWASTLLGCAAAQGRQGSAVAWDDRQYWTISQPGPWHAACQGPFPRQG
ncbi:MAG: hypothetical protein ACYCQK_01540 [Acidiferrobacteraceae bacterium]